MAKYFGQKWQRTGVPPVFHLKTSVFQLTLNGLKHILAKKVSHLSLTPPPWCDEKKEKKDPKIHFLKSVLSTSDKDIFFLFPPKVAKYFKRSSKLMKFGPEMAKIRGTPLFPPKNKCVLNFFSTLP